MARQLPGKKRTARGKKPAHKRDSSTCRECIPAKCCMYFSTEIDEPLNAKDFDDMLWMIAHRDVEIYTKEDRWYVMVKTPCRFYDATRGCIIYPSRPRICRQHHPAECEFDDDYDFDLYFRSYEELERYARKTLKKRGTPRPARP